jgi:hypothetical protein
VDTSIAMAPPRMRAWATVPWATVGWNFTNDLRDLTKEMRSFANIYHDQQTRLPWTE